MGQTPRNLGGLVPQKSNQLELPVVNRGEAPKGVGSAEKPSVKFGNEARVTGALMEAVCEHDNLECASKRVQQNKGTAGVDGMTTDELPEYLRRHWPRLREHLLAGTYQPSPVRRVTIPKDGGGERELGIPTVLDRVIQQAILQVLQPIFDPTFSEHSYGFRPGRSAHDAVRAAQRYVSEGRDWVVDVDLEQFFDRVNHDVLMGRLAKRIEDKRLLRLIRGYLTAGIMAGGLTTARDQGTPQGGPLSPLLSNVLLDEVDKELERRGHKFVRYADDCNVYVGSEKAGKRVMANLQRIYDRLKLRINKAKSKVGKASRRQFLGFVINWGPPGKARPIGIGSKAKEKLRRRIRRMTRPVIGQSLGQICQVLTSYLRGWKAYFRIAQTPNVFDTFDKWIRLRLRALQLRQWRHPWTISRALLARGCPEDLARKVAAGAGRWQRTARGFACTALPNRYFDELGLYRLAAAT